MINHRFNPRKKEYKCGIQDVVLKGLSVLEELNKADGVEKFENAILIKVIPKY